ncbi:MAG: hypothetical protein H5T86_11310, partial [Armatimonadetes bacterium]|nr:hypothetical protein [Armatimonadota bacterium]
VQWQMSVVVGSDTEEFVGSEWLDRQAGLVRWATASPGEPQERWDAVWIKVGSKTWSHPGTFDIARYYPLDQGNDWRYGQRGQWWEEYLVLPPTTVGRYTDVRPLKFWESQHDPSQDYDVHYHKIDADAFRFVAYRPSDFPQILLLREPAPSWPRPWVIGQCVRSESAFVAGQLQAPYVQVAIPVAGGLRVDTPAGSFDQCVRIVGLRLIDARSVGEGIIWEHEDIIYAPDVGPVVRQYRGKEDNAYWGPGQLFWARVNGREYGTK